MPAREFECTVTHKIWLTPTVFSLGFKPSKNFRFDSGQFLSVIIPPGSAVNPGPKRLRRIYSFAAPQEMGYELSVRLTGGPGPAYLAALNPGDRFGASAPYGDFVYKTPENRAACFISTGTGIAPFRAIILSREFNEAPPERAISLFGAQKEEDVLYAGEFEARGVREIACISRPRPSYPGFKGRVTDYLKSIANGFDWLGTDFYLCGNGAMVDDVRKLLRSMGVPVAHIFEEVYFTPAKAQTPDRASPSRAA